MIESALAEFRRSELINIFFFALFLFLAWLRPLPLRRRVEITAIGAAGIGLTFVGALLAQRRPGLATTAIRDLLPVPLMLFVYWQSGRFILKPNEWIQKFLLRLDDRLVGPVLRRQADQRTRSWFAGFLEFAYLLCYPLVPLGVGVLYAVGAQDHVDKYWVTVLLATYLCYAPLPFVQMLPPRIATPEGDHGSDPHQLRLLNLKILKHGSIQVNTFPSAHVASTTAASLALLSVAPIAGAAFLITSLSIAGGAVLGRYHYAADAVLAIVAAVAISCQR